MSKRHFLLLITFFSLLIGVSGLIFTAITGSAQESSDEDIDIDLVRAKDRNRYYGEKLGWEICLDEIYQLLGLAAGEPSPEEFALAVAKWQRAQGFADKDVDGIIGPGTWGYMEEELVSDSCLREERFKQIIGTGEEESIVKVWGLPGKLVLFFKAGMAIDADGAPNAYHPNDIGIDYNANAGYPPGPGKKPWGIVVDSDGNPYIQTEDDPFPGYFVSTTSLNDRTKQDNDTRKYVDSTKVPYIALPRTFIDDLGLKLGDFATVINGKNGKFAYAIFADQGPPRELGEGSIALAQALGHDPYTVSGEQRRARRGIKGDIVYVLFPGSGRGQGVIPTPDEIKREGEKQFKEWGGLDQVYGCYPGLTKP